MLSPLALGSRFEQSFMFHMIRDFFLLLLAVAAIEMGLRYVALRWDFSRQEPQRVERAAQQLASDIRSIMLNSGGPMAARTVYPILNRGYEDLGLSIAVQPTAVTVESMKVTFNTDVHGLQPQWSDGEHQQATVSLGAEQFCLGCHVKAKVGEVLGTVTVRSYLARKEAAWWHEVRLTAVALSLKILVHTVVLFLLLKVRMEPLLALRSTVSRLAKGVMDLSPRAAVNSADEFGELAQDLNHFLDRIVVIVRDLDLILGEVVAVGTRLGALNRGLEQQVDAFRDNALRQLDGSALRHLETRLVGAREAGAFDAEARRLSAAGSAETLQPLRNSFDAVCRALEQAAPTVQITQAQSAEYQAFAQSLRDMAVLEAAMQKVAESGRHLLAQLAQPREDTPHQRLADSA
jgi:methyl-accepting chemotaxis protein